MISLTLSTSIVLQPQERLDRQQGSLLQEKVTSLAFKPDSILAIDMSEVKFVDSAGLCALVSSLRLARDMGVRMVLCSLADTVRLVLEISQLDRVFEIFDSYEEVMASCSAKPQLSHKEIPVAA